MSFAIGDLVQLKSGGPVMTVSSSPQNNGTLYCTWFTDDHSKPCYESFKPEILKPSN